jgi:hypothetical protein
VTGHYKMDMGEGQPVLQSKDPEGVTQDLGAVRRYQATCQIADTRADARFSPGPANQD